LYVDIVIIDNYSSVRNIYKIKDYNLKIRGGFAGARSPLAINEYYFWNEPCMSDA